MRRILAILTMLWAAPALGAEISQGWTNLTDAAGGDCRLKNTGAACYLDANNVGDGNWSPILTDGSQCGQIFTQIDVVTGTCQLDIQACDAKGNICNDLPNGTDLTSDGVGPEGGTVAGLRVYFDEATSCEVEVQVVCSEN